ncbi:hypothetical protein D521_0802 [beta proteobacterium CB]|nr:hypothetical protein D521_0802 [beta proteobacterium CB]
MRFLKSPVDILSTSIAARLAASFLSQSLVIAVFFVVLVVLIAQARSKT